MALRDRRLDRAVVLSEDRGAAGVVVESVFLEELVEDEFCAKGGTTSVLTTRSVFFRRLDSCRLCRTGVGGCDD